MPTEPQASLSLFCSIVLLSFTESSTDPIAVAAVLKTSGANPRLVMHITGESLLNDGSSVVLFTIAMSVWFEYIDLAGVKDEESINSVAEGLIFFLREALGGCVVGTVIGFALDFVLGLLDTNMEKNFDILQPVTAIMVSYGCYYVCDEMVNVSGMIGVVACGLFVNRYGKGLINDEELMNDYLVLVRSLLIV